MNIITIGSIFAGVLVAFGYLVWAFEALQRAQTEGGGRRPPKPKTVLLVALAIIALSNLPILSVPYASWRDQSHEREARAAFAGWYAGANPGAVAPVLTSLQHPDTWLYVYTQEGKAYQVLKVNQGWLVLSSPQPAATPTS
jgi:heme/copper-type cytochrome/quinol oxidase subunit 2